jgi:hypothetical protein
MSELMQDWKNLSKSTKFIIILSLISIIFTILIILSSGLSNSSLVDVMDTSTTEQFSGF